MRSANAQLRSLAEEIQFEFGNLSDCVWKFNGQIDELRRIELAKLDAYFPNDAPTRAWRWKSESYKVNFFFPLALNYSFVVLVFIQLETKLMQLCSLLRDLRHSSFSVKDLAGRGVEKYAVYIERAGGIKRSEMKNWKQIAALQQIRNCIVHTAGFVAQARDSVNLRDVVVQERFSVPRQRRHVVASRLNKSPGDLDISIIQHQGMDRLMVKMEYPHAANSYVRDFLLDLIEKINASSRSVSKVSQKH